uniref:Zona pellucida sperm-binding protein 3 n=1 Tax=Astyanax mexicanus TaxID=7994 RepID=A0A3B1J0D3_ASTMX
MAQIFLYLTVVGNFSMDNIFHSTTDEPPTADHIELDWCHLCHTNSRSRGVLRALQCGRSHLCLFLHKSSSRKQQKQSSVFHRISKMALKQCGVGVLLVLVLGVCNAQFGNPVGAPAQPTLPNVPGLGGISNSPQTPLSVQLKQMLGPVKKLMWHYPQAPVKPQQPAVHFEPPQPVRATSVAVQCSENNVYVQVKKDFLGTGELISPAEITLGGCAATGEDSAAQVYLFQAELQLCNGVSMVSEDELVYSFNIIYVPKTSTPSSVGSPVVRTKSTVVGIECHYPRKFNVSSNVLLPAWIPYAATVTAEERLVFSASFSPDDWQFERPSNQYILGDFINIEAAVMQYNHVPLRIFVDSCVATTVPDLNTTPRYSFIEPSRCLVDAKLTGSQSRFLPREDCSVLYSLYCSCGLMAFAPLQIYLTCFLKAAAAASAPTDAVHKACSFSNNG